jgi:hypothetical protein
MKIEDEIEAMFPFQREVIARATLAGCRFEAKPHQRRIGGSRGSGAKGAWVPTTTYYAFLPDGSPLKRYPGGYEDVYAAALACLAVLDYVRPTEDVAFKLTEGNEQ